MTPSLLHRIVIAIALIGLTTLLLVDLNRLRHEKNPSPSESPRDLPTTRIVESLDEAEVLGFALPKQANQKTQYF
jgi:hypothetical protein